ncbi:protein phosphatase 2C domain-containing protein [Saxibacter everestensis]|uniref:Protein phosphatase 2C domain-containing protein n=1 Tax=Saxibacter everestensis TaxID=2909229 RepID=A0ABY8QU92_9MICO|nr:protein phosphatase 2C domain-containing protein [Brevibacteriaceae bacterium ZFBP1038]
MSPEQQNSPPPALKFVARSHTGSVRSNNQDSGYAGPNLLLVADGMGGHAGGDVASAVTVAELEHLDSDDHGLEALEHLRLAILDANDRLSERVAAQPELAGMGTTVTALLRADGRFALAHIGDSRAYVLRDGELAQVTHDHTFVQLLVDEGRITPEEAERHPQRSVVMRVLGDVGSSPELDLSIREAKVGDRWLLCSDGLSGFTSDANIENALHEIADLGACADRLVDLALEGGGADNVTVILADVVADANDATERHELVGSVRINPSYSHRVHTGEVPETKAAAGAISDLPVELSAEDDSSHPADDKDGRESGSGKAGRRGKKPHDDDVDDDDLADWDDEHPRRRRWLPPLVIGIVVALAIAVGWGSYAYTQSQYFVGSHQGKVAIYQGVSQDLGPIRLSHLYEEQEVSVTSLPTYSQQRVSQTIPADSLDAARQVVESLKNNSDNPPAPGLEGPTATPTASMTPGERPTGGVRKP